MTRVLVLTFLACVLAAVSIDEGESQVPFRYSDKLSVLMPLAEKGDAGAQMQLGIKYLKGFGVDKDITEGLRWLRASGDQGFIRAQLYLGEHYADRANDEPAALSWFRRAAENLSEPEGVIAARMAGVILARSADTQREAASYFRQAAERDDAQAQVLLGTLYIDGRGLDKSFADGLKWIEQAETKRYITPKYLLALIFAEGLGTPPNVHEAASRLYGVAKGRTEADVAYLIGTFYHRGFWVPREDKPILWWALERMGADEKAIHRYFNAQRVRADYQWADARQAITWYLKAADAGHIGAMVNLGVIHFKGDNWDCSEGVKWMRKAADRGDATAQFNLGFFFLRTPEPRSDVTIGIVGENVLEGVRVESVDADGPASRAGLRAGDTIISANGRTLDTFGIEDLQAIMKQSVQLKLLIKRDGEDATRSIDVFANRTWMKCPGADTPGLRANPAEAFGWFEKSAAGGHPSGLFYLAAAYQEGKGTARDPKKAMELYRKGAERGDWEAAQAIAHMYARGDGVDQSKSLSDEWFAKAVELRHRAVGRH